jgi:hypothetical protein
VGSIDLRKDKSLFKVISQEEAKIDKSDLVGRYPPLLRLFTASFKAL